MNILLFKRKNNNIRLCTELQVFECELSEIEAIEIMVSILRANYEITYLRETRTDIYEVAKKSTIKIIKKEMYGLEIYLMNQKITLDLFGNHLLQYDFDSFKEQCEMIYSFLKQNYGKGSIDYKMFSPTYLEHMLGVDIPKIERVEFTTERILSLALYEREGISTPTKVHINQHSLYKKLQQGYTDDGTKSTNHIYESNTERMNSVMKEVKGKSKLFPVVVYGEEVVVRDGTHRLACLYYLYGNIDVSVIRVYVKNPYYSYTMYRAIINNIEKEVVK